MQNLGDRRIDDYITFGVQLHRFSSGAVYAPTGSVTYTFYENNSTSGAPTGGNLAQLNSKTGLYSARVQLTTAAGFEAGKDYFVHVEATVDGVAAGELFSFRVIDVPTVDVTKLGGSTQSATDLKDFADDGYDPSTNKVQGVVLVDTLTTYTGNTPQTGDTYAKVDTEVATIISDIATLAAYVDTEVAAIKAKTDNLSADPADASDIAALLATITGYIDTEVAAILAAVDTEVAAIKIVTDAIGATGVGLSAIPWNAAWDAEVQSEVADALAATDAIVGASISTAAANKIADILLRRASSNIEASSDGESLSLKSLYGALAMMTHAKDASSGTSLVLKKADGSTTLATIPIDTDAAADPIVGTS